ncbi:MAG: nucleotidyltransferase family protein [Ilumatobacteraceae bacterium]|jgi:CTP:molybdopterin cytidylyltransferase MocA
MDDSTSGSADGGRTAAVLLAAGAGTRFSGASHKLLAEIGGQPIYLLALTHAVRAAVGPVIVVTGAVELALPDGLGDRVTLVHNPDWRHGQSTSLLRGVTEARRMGTTAVLVGLADQPGVTVEAWRRLAASRSDLAVATYDGHRGHPVRIGARHWDELPTSGDIGARDILSVHASGVEQVPCAGTATDIDTAEDLATWLRRSSTNSP